MSLDTTRLAPGRLAALVGSRLCHDLVSPLGAIGNGVELLEMSGEFPGITQSPELRLISESVAATRDRIQAFRMAFGLAQGEQRIGLAELTRLVQGLAAQGKLKIELDAAGDFARAEIRMVMLALMCLETAMPWGGHVVLLHGQTGWKLVAEGDRMKPDAALWSWLSGGTEEMCRPPAASEVHFALLGEAALETGRRVAWEMDEKGAEITF